MAQSLCARKIKTMTEINTSIHLSESQLREMICCIWTEYQQLLMKSLKGIEVDKSRLIELRDLHSHLTVNKNRMIKGIKAA
jgi:hypothetical protein